MHHRIFGRNGPTLGKCVLIGADGRQYEQEVRGPPEFPTLLQCYRVLAATLAISGEVIPPVRRHIVDMQERFHILCPNCWALEYQADDRFQHEKFPDILRTDSARYDRMISRGWWLAGKKTLNSIWTSHGTTYSGWLYTEHPNINGGTITLSFRRRTLSTAS